MKRVTTDLFYVTPLHISYKVTKIPKIRVSSERIHVKMGMVDTLGKGRNPFSVTWVRFSCLHSRISSLKSNAAFGLVTALWPAVRYSLLSFKGTGAKGRGKHEVSQTQLAGRASYLVQVSVVKPTEYRTSSQSR